MRQRSALVRFLATGWAAFQLASPAVTAIADGSLANANAVGPATHVESTSSASCPRVHPPDCAICRYLSGPASPLPSAGSGLLVLEDMRSPRAETRLPYAVSIALPHGRGPPSLNVWALRAW